MNKGFTLVEVLVAVVILSIGILAVSQMTVMGLKTTSVINQRLYARTTMARVFEDLNARPVTDSFLDDDGDNTDLDDDTTGDYTQTVSDSLAKISYDVLWNVADNIPETGLKTVRIFVKWGPGNKYSISTNIIKRM
jgi:prepilin-type N-terminal cleavage/methylation domain-containing protein